MMKTNPSQPSTTKRLTAYSSIAAATASAGGTANAAVVVHDVTDITVAVADDNTVFNMVTGATTVNTGESVYSDSYRFALRTFINGNTGDDVGFLEMGYFGGLAGRIGAVGTSSVFGSSYPGVTVLAGGSISAGQNFENYYGIGLGEGGQTGWGFSEGQTGFVGLKFEISGSTHYGWVQLTRDANSDDYILHGFGYDNSPGSAAETENTVDAIPEAGSLALLALGSTGLMMRRKRQRKN